MMDRPLQAFLKPALQAMAAALLRRGVTADTATGVGFALGLAGAALIAFQLPLAALPFLLLSRLMDGLDGALARLTQPTDRGAFLDITLDFLFYASVPLAFAVSNPFVNGLPAAVLLAAFIGTGSSFLAFAVLAERRGLSSQAYPSKGFFYLGAMCLWPQHFPLLAFGFAALCGLTLISRLIAGWRLLG
jgi:phosphatidylglycerophosphate synthase